MCQLKLKVTVELHLLGQIPRWGAHTESLHNCRCDHQHMVTIINFNELSQSRTGLGQLQAVHLPPRQHLVEAGAVAHQQPPAPPKVVPRPRHHLAVASP